MCVCLCFSVCSYGCTCRRVKAWGTTVTVISHRLSTLLFETGSLTGPVLAKKSRLVGWPASLRDPLMSASTALGLQVPTIIPCFKKKKRKGKETWIMGRELNSWCLQGKGSTFLTDLSPQPLPQLLQWINWHTILENKLESHTQHPKCITRAYRLSAIR